MNYLFTILFSLFLHPNEQYTANSIEWLCYDSPGIVLAKFDSYQLEHKKFFDYPDRYAINATIKKVYKGPLQIEKKIVIYCSINSRFEDEWKKNMGNEVFVFLKTMTLEDKIVYYAWDPEMGIIDLTNPEDKAINGLFSILNNKEEINMFIEYSIEKLKGIKANKSFIAVPDNNTSFPINMEGLYVPDCMYPNATLVK
jgi:hypothetical protein